LFWNFLNFIRPLKTDVSRWQLSQ